MPKPERSATTDLTLALLADEALERVAEGASLPEALDALVRFVGRQAEGLACAVEVTGEGGETVRAAASAGVPDGSGLHAASTWTTPILGADGTALGTFRAYFPEPRRPTLREEAVVERAAQLARIAIERLRREDALRATTSRLAGLIDGLRSGILFTDRARATRLVNRSFCELFGLREPPEAFLGKHGRPLAERVSALFPDPAGFLQRIEELMARGEPVLGEEIILADGRTYERDFVPIPGEHGGRFWQFRDVTDRKRLQARMIFTDRMASMGTLAAGVAHEINNPLSYVLANLGHVAEEIGRISDDLPSSGRDLAQALHEARDGAERVRRIVRDLRAFSRVDEDRRGPVNVRAVLESTLSLAMNEIRHRARLAREYAETPLVDANESRLGQVFLNLVLNAAQAIPEGAADRNEIRLLTATDAAGRAVVEVRDTGCGIPPEHRGSLFAPFFTTKPIGVGTGLGLSICHGIVTALGGEIQVESEVGVGSTFRVILPPAVVKHRAPTPTPAPIATRRRASVLVVDDEPLVVTSIRRLLSGAHDVVGVTSAEDALAAVERGARFDLILCDLMMPVRTGMDLHADLGRVDPDQARRMVFMTGGAFTTLSQEFLQGVPNPLLEKPFEPERLRAMVRDLLEG